MGPPHVNPLAPFARWTAFPSSDDDGASDADTLHCWTAHLPVYASHVHDDGLCKLV